MPKVPATPIDVLFVASGLNYGGAETQLIATIKRLHALGHRPSLYLLTAIAPRRAELDAIGVTITIDPKRRPLDLAVLARLRAHMRQLAPQIVHSFLFDANVYSRLAGAGLGLEVINSERNHGYRLKAAQAALHFPTRWLADAVIANSHAGEAFAQRLFGFGPTRTYTVWNGIDLAAIDRKVADSAGRDYRGEFFADAGFRMAVVVGAIKPQKDPLLALDVAESLIDADPEWRVVFVGASLDRAGRRYASSAVSASTALEAQVLLRWQTSRHRERIAFVGQRDDAVEIIAAADVLFSTSHHEGFPNVVLEAMAVRTPVVSTVYSDIERILPAGALVRQRDATALRDAILRIAAEGEALGADLRRWVEERATIAAATDRLLAIYRERIRSRSSGGGDGKSSGWQASSPFDPAGAADASRPPAGAPDGVAHRTLLVWRPAVEDGVSGLALDALAERYDLRPHSREVAAQPPGCSRIERWLRRIDRLVYPQPRARRRAEATNFAADEPVDAVVDLLRRPGDARQPTPGPVNPAPVLAFTFDGEPLSRLAEAVRYRLQVVGGVVTAIVWLCPPDGPPEALFGGLCCIDHRSLARSVTWLAAKLPALVDGALARLSRPGSPRWVAPALDFGPTPAPGRLIAGLFGRLIRRFMIREQWVIELHDRWPGTWPWPNRARRVIEPPRNGFWADPFLLSQAGRRWLMFEEQAFGASKAHISALEIDVLGRPLGPARCVLREPWHLSYPFVWQDTGGKLLMVPESVAARQVALYESDSPLGPWQLRSVLLQGRRWADSTLMPYGGRWWLFASSAAERGCPHDELWAYHADRIDGPWRGHALNPLKIDARSARPAGAMGIDADGFPYRVAQDCSTVYGGAVRLMRIVALDPERYEEEEVEPGNAFRTTRPWHTLNADDHGVVIDTLRRRSRWGWRGSRADGVAPVPTQNGNAATGQF